MANVSLWVPLDPIPSTIALRCIAGSHQLARRFIPNRFVDDSPYVAHAPGTATHSLRRRIVSYRYVGDDARWITRPWKTSPPFEPEGLNDGDVLDDARFPRVSLD
jgi:ectoine hydroxylase-related dioxygenase (phytanoyl-CoA dioxygenase family)